MSKAFEKKSPSEKKGRALLCERDKDYRCEQNKIIILPQLTLRSESGTHAHSNKNGGNRYKKDG